MNDIVKRFDDMITNSIAESGVKRKYEVVL